MRAGKEPYMQSSLPLHETDKNATLKENEKKQNARNAKDQTHYSCQKTMPPK